MYKQFSFYSLKQDMHTVTQHHLKYISQAWQAPTNPIKAYPVNKCVGNYVCMWRRLGFPLQLFKTQQTHAGSGRL